MLRIKKLSIGLFAIIILIMFTVSGLGVLNARAESNDVYSSTVDNGIYDEYTDIDIHYGIPISNFYNFYASGVNITEQHNKVYLQVELENPIVYFIPRELFQSEGVTSYIGKEYGFITDTFSVEGSDALHTIVMLFDIEMKDDFLLSKDHLKIRITPVFQGEFAYITPQTKVIKGVKSNNQIGYDGAHQGVLYVDAEAECVIPVPTTKTSYVTAVSQCVFSPVNKYYLKNFKSLVSLYNENHLNAFDEGYILEQDQGAYFTQMDFAYSGHFYEPGEVSIKDVGNVIISVASIGLDCLRIAKIFPPANPLISLAGHVADYVQSCITLARNAVDEMKPLDKNLTYIPDFTTAKEQIAQKGYLTKDAMIEVASADNNELVLTTGDFIEADYQISATDPSWKTRYVAALTIEALDLKSGSSFGISNVPYSENLAFAAAEEEITIEEGAESTAYFLPGGTQKNYIFTDYTGWYHNYKRISPSS